MQDSRTAAHCSKLPLRTPIGYESLPQVSVLALLGWLITPRKPARTPNAIVEEVQSYANDIMQYHSISRGSQINFPSRLSTSRRVAESAFLALPYLPACLTVFGQTARLPIYLREIGSQGIWLKNRYLDI